MLKKLMILAAVVLMPMALASAASAAPAQYPPSAGGVSGGGTSGGVSGGSAQSGNGTTLARTGSDNGPLVLVGVALVTVGGIALVTSRRLRSTT